MNAHVTSPEVVDVARMVPPVVMCGEVTIKYIIDWVDGSTGVCRLRFEEFIGLLKISWAGLRIVIEKHDLVG